MYGLREGTATGPSKRLSRWPSIRQTRLAAGLVLFAYVTEHIFNLVLGNVSLAAMEEALRWQKFVWGSPPAAIALFGSLLVHMALGFWALFTRRRLNYTRLEAIQVGLGLAIPFLLAGHLVWTRVAPAFGLERGYAGELFRLWSGPLDLGAQQIALVLAVWIHGCIGMHQASIPRLRSGWLRQVGFAIALLLPTLALLGYAQGGRTVLRLEEDPAWRAGHTSAASLGTEPQRERLYWLTHALQTALAAALVGTLLARSGRGWRASRRGALQFAFPQSSVRAPHGFSVLEAAQSRDIALAHVCGGRARCSTCRVRVISNLAALPVATAIERAVLDRIKAAVDVRLACQLRPLEDIAIVPLLPPHASTEMAFRRNAAHFGNERYLVPMFVDMRDSTRLAEQRLAFDTVFLINRFLEAASRAAFAAGGTPNQILGDGLLILFGLDVSADVAARQALDCCRKIAENVAVLNASLAPELPNPIRFGVGVHAGNVVVGDIGYERHTTFTAIGDAVNVASRLQDLSKTLNCEAVISEEVGQKAGFDLAEFPTQEVTARGRAGALRVHCVPSALQLKRLFELST